MICVLPQLLSPETVWQARKLLSGLPEADWADGRASAGSQARQVKSNLQLPHDHAVAKQIRAWVLAGWTSRPNFSRPHCRSKCSPLA